MPSKEYTWHKVAEQIGELTFASNRIAVVEVANKKVCVAEWQGRYYAFAYKCPHAGGVMANGYIDPLGNVVCPLHRYRFSLEHGRNVSGEGYYLKHWPVECREDGVYVAQEKGGIFGF